MIRAPAPLPDASVRRMRVRLTGAVQGVGMRPFVYGLAQDLGLAGFVLNGVDGVTIEVEGVRLADFLARLALEAPPLARIEAIDWQALPETGATDFVIEASGTGQATTRIVPDAATCPECLAEIFGPASRFHRYPFTNCTHCGPRYTITRTLPYDRPQTAMAGFPMCAACDADYRDPANRRFHAEPIACPDCGPKLSAPIPEIAAAIRLGKIVALKGIGGFHLMCDARNETAVTALRQRKSREAKPFAVMVANDASLDLVAAPVPQERALVTTLARPIVLMRSLDGVLAPSVSPNLKRVGVLLAYAPVHHLLFAELGGTTDPQASNPYILVATSANPGCEPLVIDDEDARRRLGGIADLIVTHDRPIFIRADDSVAQIIAGRPAMLRRARGFVPEPIDLGTDGPSVLALGAHLKATVTLTRGREAFVSQHIGDLDTVETMRFYREAIDHLTRLLDVNPEAIATDLHPDYRSSQLAEDFDLPVIPVQHHVAHMAAVAGEHGLDGPVLGLAIDGHGVGPNGENWGGELIRLDGADWRHLGGLSPLPLPGADLAAREPRRMAAGVLHQLGRGNAIAARFPDWREAPALAHHLAKSQKIPITSSLGRLFDAASGLLGLCARQDYEGQAAMELEARVTAPKLLAGGYRIDGGTLDFRPLLAQLLDIPDATEGANLFHGTVAAGLADWVVRASVTENIRTIVIGGGAAANRVLIEDLLARLARAGLTAHVPERLPAGDGGLSFGQAVVARARAFPGEVGTGSPSGNAIDQRVRSTTTT